MTPEQARQLITEVDSAAARAAALVAGMDDAALRRRPSSGGWSVAENVQHLILTAGAMLPLAESAVAALERDRPPARGEAGLGFLGWMLFKSLEPPSRMKIKTTKPFEPIDVKDALTLVDRLRVNDEKLKALISRATGLDTTRVKVTSPFNDKVKYNLYAAFRIMLSHTRRHLWQAEQVKAAK
jgi:hypothetical protein